MELIVTISIICIVLILLMQTMRKPLAKPDRISGSPYWYSPTLVFALGFAMTFVAAFQQGFQDTGVYKNLYTYIGTDFENAFDKEFAIQDYGFNLFMVLLNHINPDPQFLITVSAIIILSIYSYITAKYSADVPFSFFLFLCTVYISTMNGIRQVLAGALLTLALPWVRDKKMIPYLLLALILSSFHASMIIMLPLYFIISGKRMNKGIWLFLAFIVMCFAAPSVADRLMGSVLEDSIYEDYLKNESKMGIMRLIVAAVPTLLSVLYCWIQRENHDGEDVNNPHYKTQRLTDILINMQIVSFGFTALGLRMVYFARISMYFSCVLPLLLPIIIQGCFTERSSRLVKRISIIMYLFYHAYQIYTYESIGGWAGFELAF